MGSGQPPQLVQRPRHTVLCDVRGHFLVGETELLQRDLVTRGRCGVDEDEVDPHCVPEVAAGSLHWSNGEYSLQAELLEGHHGAWILNHGDNHK